MFQRYAVEYTTTANPNTVFTTSVVEIGEDIDPRVEIAKMIACRRFGQAKMADHVEISACIAFDQPRETP